MKKIIAIVFAFTCIGSFSAFGQMYHHGAGLGLASTIDGTAGTPLIQYNARLNISEMSDNLSLSLSATPGVWLSFATNSQTGASGSAGLDVPLTVDLNFGALSTYDYDPMVGGFVSAGAGLTMAGGDNGNIVAFGPLVRAGIRSMIADEYPVGLWGGFMVDLNSSNSSVGLFSLGALYYLGDY